MVLETNMTEIMTRINEQEKLEKEEVRKYAKMNPHQKISPFLMGFQKNDSRQKHGISF